MKLEEVSREKSADFTGGEEKSDYDFTMVKF